MRLGNMVVSLLAVGLLVACSGGTETGTASGGCSADVDCKGDRVCVAGACVAPGGADRSDVDSTETSKGGASETNGGGSGGGGNSDDGIRCSEGDGACTCGHSADYGAGTSCGPGDVGGEARCCAGAGWPAASNCTCLRVACVKGPWSCACYAGAHASAGESLVEGCSTGVCCVDTTNGICHCNTDGSTTTCAPGSTPVSSCQTSSATCGDRTQVSSCR